MKKIILILGGVSFLMLRIIYVLYTNHIEKKEVNIDIFDDEATLENEDFEDDKEEEHTFKVSVDIKGMVLNPGVYEMDNNSRVEDVIAKAGGLLEGADTSLLNLAKIVTDEMTIIVYSNEEVLEKLKGEICVCDCPIRENDACIEEDNTGIDGKLININTATLEELMELPGIGSAKAKEIIAFRTNSGPFNSIEDIKSVNGIGEETFEKIKIYITI